MRVVCANQEWRAVGLSESLDEGKLGCERMEPVAFVEHALRHDFMSFDIAHPIGVILEATEASL